MTNSRGRPPFWHESLSPDDDAFWAFSWDEMASLDLPATVAHILGATGASSLSYVGHSQGTTLAMVGLSENATVAAQVDLAVLLAPVGLLNHGAFGNMSLLVDAANTFCKLIPSTCDMSVWDA